VSGGQATVLVDVRPVRLVRVARVAAALIVAVFVVVAVALGTAGEGPVRPGQLRFGVADQLAMVGLGLLAAGAALLFTRPRVTADAEGVTVRNVLTEHRLPWQVVTSVGLADGEPWARLDLADDDQLAVMALQAGDGRHAVEGVLALRRLLEASRTAPRSGEAVGAASHEAPDADTGDAPEAPGEALGEAPGVAPGEAPGEAPDGAAGG
jgi:hypothetical protein